MCIIAVKYKGCDFATEQEIKTCMVNNPDGFSMAWNEGGQIKTFKSMNADEMLRTYREVVRSLDAKKTGMIFHARIATHGSKCLDNCHCWVGNDGMLDIAFAHNGILMSMTPQNNMTDSETFFRNFYLPALAISDEYADSIAKLIIGSSKMVFLYPNGHIKTMGAFERCDDNPQRKGTIYFSNKTFLVNRYSVDTYWNSRKPHTAATRMEPQRIKDISLKSLGISVTQDKDGNKVVRSVDYAKRMMETQGKQLTLDIPEK